MFDVPRCNPKEKRSHSRIAHLYNTLEAPSLLQVFNKYGCGIEVVKKMVPGVRETRIQILPTSLTISGALGK
jgi:hypothetical protein